MAHRHRPIWLWWTGGKDSAWSLRVLRRCPQWEVSGLIAPVNRENDRVIMHGVHGRLLELQAAAVGLPLSKVSFDWTKPTSTTRTAIQAGIARTCRNGGARHVAYPDLRIRLQSRVSH